MEKNIFKWVLFEDFKFVKFYGKVNRKTNFAILDNPFYLLSPWQKIFVVKFDWNWCEKVLDTQFSLLKFELCAIHGFYWLHLLSFFGHSLKFLKRSFYYFKTFLIFFFFETSFLKFLKSDFWNKIFKTILRSKFPK